MTSEVSIDMVQAFRDKKAPRFTTIRSTESKVDGYHDYVWKGLIAPADFAMLLGQPGGGKSVLAPALGHHVSRGANFMGRRTKKGPVLYIAAEGQRDLLQRCTALNQEYGDAPDLHILAESINLRDRDHQQAVAAIMRKLNPVLTILDTLAAAMPGLEENDASSMGEAVFAMRGLTLVNGCALLGIHHPPKSGDTPRGHSILNGNLDLTIMLENDNNIRRGYLGKNRNGRVDGAGIEFKIGVVSLGIDQDGDPIEKPVYRPVIEGDAETERKRLPATAALALRILHDVVNNDGHQLDDRPGFPGHRFYGVRLEKWEAECKSRSLTMDSAQDRAVFLKAAGDLRKFSRIGVKDGIVWATDRKPLADE